MVIEVPKNNRNDTQNIFDVIIHVLHSLRFSRMKVLSFFITFFSIHLSVESPYRTIVSREHYNVLQYQSHHTSNETLNVDTT